jgi:hypothetical protein
MALVGSTNRRDPRFQEALLRAGAGGPKNLIGVSKRATAAHTGREMNQRLAFAKLAEQQRYFNERLGLSRSRLQIQNRMFKQRLHDSRQNLNRTMGLGLLTTGFGFLEGRRRKQLTAEDNADRAAWQKEYRGMRRKEHDAFMKRQYPSAGWAWTDEEQ